MLFKVSNINVFMHKYLFVLSVIHQIYFFIFKGFLKKQNASVTNLHIN